MGRDLASTHIGGEIRDDATGEVTGFFEQYGIHRTEIPLANNGGPTQTAKIYRRLVEAARTELTAADERTDLEIIETATEPADMIVAILDWSDDVAIRRGHLSRQYMATRFLATRTLLELHVTVAPDRVEIVRAAMGGGCCFADAWHFWHMEVFGEHNIAFDGRQSADDRARGVDAVKRRKVARHAAIIAAIGKNLFENPAVSNPDIADARLKSVEGVLRERGFDPIPNRRAFLKWLERNRPKAR
jgi:hypothetical protein